MLDPRLPPKPPDMRKMLRLSVADRRQTQADWLHEQRITFNDSEKGIDRAFAQAGQNRSRAEQAAAGDSRRADAEYER